MNFERFRIPTGLAGLSKSGGQPLRPGPKEHFLKGPVPLNWLRVAAALPGRAMAVGIYIWYLAGLKKSNCVTLPTTKVDAFGVDRFAQYRALTALEKAGLVSLERHRGRHPIITLKATPAKTEGGDRNA